MILLKISASPRMRMMLVGALSVTLAYATFSLLIISGVYYQIASFASFFTYLVINFVSNRVWAFKSTGDVKGEVFAYVGLHLSNQVLIMIGLHVLVEYASIHPGWSQIIMQVIVTGIVLWVTPLIFGHKK